MLQLQASSARVGLRIGDLRRAHRPGPPGPRSARCTAIAGSESELLLLHHSMGHEAFDDVVGASQSTIVAVYHNVTPEQYFEDEVAVGHPARARDQLEVLARRSLFGMAESNFNRRRDAGRRFPPGRGHAGPGGLQRVRHDSARTAAVTSGRRTLQRLAVRRPDHRQQVPAATWSPPSPHYAPDLRRGGAAGPGRRHLGHRVRGTRSGPRPSAAREWRTT